MIESVAAPEAPAPAPETPRAQMIAHQRERIADLLRGPDPLTPTVVTPVSVPIPDPEPPTLQSQFAEALFTMLGSPVVLQRFEQLLTHKDATHALKAWELLLKHGLLSLRAESRGGPGGSSRVQIVNLVERPPR